jgi:hypothetical protein
MEITISFGDAGMCPAGCKRLEEAQESAKLAAKATLWFQARRHRLHMHGEGEATRNQGRHVILSAGIKPRCQVMATGRNWVAG